MGNGNRSCSVWPWTMAAQKEGPWLPRKEGYFQLAAQKRPSELLAVCTQAVFFPAELQKSPAGNLNLQDADFRSNNKPISFNAVIYTIMVTFYTAMANLYTAMVIYFLEHSRMLCQRSPPL